MFFKVIFIKQKLEEGNFMYNVLVCDDDKEIVEAIEIYLKREGYNILKAYNGREALKIVKENDDIHLILLDIMMPELDGISVANLIRKDKAIPIIMLSAKSEDYDKISGLNNGADDYITKPFNPLELIARVKSQLRRYMTLGNYVNVSKEDEKVIKSSGLEINLESKEVFVEGESIRVTATEFGILELLLKNKGRVFSIDEIYENVWKEPSYNAENTVAVHIRRIREKIEINPKEPKYLKVVWGIGYKIEKYE